MKTIQTQKPKKSQNSASSVSRKELLDERGKFKKGHPKVGGSKKGSSFSLLAILKKELQKIPKELKGKERKRYADLLIKKQIHKAIVEGDDASIRLIWNYIEGMPKEKIDLTSGDQPFGNFIEELGGEIQKVIQKAEQEIKKELAKKIK